MPDNVTDFPSFYDTCGSTCDGWCENDCQDTCFANCADDCWGSCYTGCDGGCIGGCYGCRGSCGNNCTGSCRGGCNNTCTGGCKNTCTGSCVHSCTGCTNTCKTECNTACSGHNEAESISNLGNNIINGHIIKASDYTSIKLAIDNEYRRRGKSVPAPFNNLKPNTPVTMNNTQKLLVDIFRFDSDPSHDWSKTFTAGENIPPSSWQPIIAHVKSLMSTVVPVK